MARRGRISFQDKIRANQRSLAFLAASAGVPEHPDLKIETKPRRKRSSGRRSATGGQRIPLERSVLKAVYSALHHHPKVAFVDRRQSGVFMEGERTIRVGKPGVLDLSGMLKGGRYFEIEVKRPGQKPTNLQWQRIETINRWGGASGFVTCVEDISHILRD